MVHADDFIGVTHSGCPLVAVPSSPCAVKDAVCKCQLQGNLHCVPTLQQKAKEGTTTPASVKCSKEANQSIREGEPFELPVHVAETQPGQATT